MKISYLATSLFLAFGYITPHAQADFLRTVALSNQASPGDVGNFATFNTPVLNNSGHTAFSGTTSLGGGLWSEGAGSGLDLVTRSGNTAPGTGAGELFSFFGAPVLNDNGQLAFAGYFEGTELSSGHDGIWIEEGGSESRLVARVGDSAPDTDMDFVFLSDHVLSNNGSVGFGGFVDGPRLGIWSEGDGSGLALIALGGNPAPGTSKGFGFISSIVLNGSGQSAFSDATSAIGVWSDRGGAGLASIVLQGDPYPGDDSGATLFFVSVTVMNDNGQVAFASRSLFLPPNDIGASTGIWSEGIGGGFTLVAQEGSPAPGTESGVNFASFDPPGDLDEIVINGNGHTAFWAELAGPGIGLGRNHTGIWSEGGGSGLALVARIGDPTPGTETGVTFTFLDDEIVLNKLGQTAFKSQLGGPGVDSTNGSGIWAQDILGNVRLIARAGDLLDVDDGPGTDFREIHFLNFASGTGNEDGRASGFNDLGQLAFWASFTDGSSGIFVSNLVAVPEPSTLFFATLAAVGILINRKRCIALKYEP